MATWSSRLDGPTYEIFDVHVTSIKQNRFVPSTKKKSSPERTLLASLLGAKDATRGSWPYY